jgi:hypothetical protein
MTALQNDRATAVKYDRATAVKCFIIISAVDDALI